MPSFSLHPSYFCMSVVVSRLDGLPDIIFNPYGKKEAVNCNNLYKCSSLHENTPCQFTTRNVSYQTNLAGTTHFVATLYLLFDLTRQNWSRNVLRQNFDQHLAILGNFDLKFLKSCMLQRIQLRRCENCFQTTSQKWISRQKFQTKLVVIEKI